MQLKDKICITISKKISKIAMIKFKKTKMKKSLLTFGALFAFAFGYAQLPNNSICPDFTGTDLNGNTWNLYEILDSGKPVIIEVSAAWCGPCWSYHSSHNLKNFYEQYGPDGTDEAMVLFIEGEGSNTLAQLQGTTTNNQNSGYTRGDWITGTPFPIIDDASIANILQISYFPTIYLVCPDRIVTEIGQVTTAQAYTAVSNANCTPASVEIDPRFVEATGVNATCSNPTAGINILMQNKGTTPLTSATIQVSGGGITPITQEWTGNLATYETTTITITGIETNGLVNANVTVTSTDNNPDNSTAIVPVNSFISETSTQIRVVFTNDPWPEENSWRIKNSSGTVVASSPSFSANPGSATTNTYNYWVPSTGCYTFEFRDAYGDGLNGGAYTGGWNGNINVYSVEADGSTSLIYNNPGTSPMGTTAGTPVIEKTPFQATSVVGVNELSSETSVFGIYPNPTSGQVNLNYTLTHDASVTVDVINSVGTRVMSEKLGSQKFGTYSTPLDLSSLAAGVYMVNLNADGVLGTVRVVIK